MPKAKPTVAITPTVHAKMQAAVDYLNAHLFDGELPDAFLVFQRRAHSGGHFAPDRYVHRDAKDNHQHEINLNPDHFVGETDEKILCPTCFVRPPSALLIPTPTCGRSFTRLPWQPRTCEALS